MKILKKLDAKWYYMLSELVNKGSSYGILLILSYFLTDVQYGQITLFNSILTLAVVFASLDLTRNYITRMFFDKDANIKDIIESIVSFLAVFSLLLLLVIVVVMQFKEIYSVPTGLIALGILVAIFMSNFDILHAVFVATEQKVSYCIISIIYSVSVFGVALGTYFLFPETGIYAFIGAKLFLSFISSVCSVAYFVYKYHIRFRIKWNIITPAIKYSAPLMLHTISGFLLNYLDRFMINDMIGTADTALYTFSHNLAMVLSILVTAVNQSFIPRFYKLLGDENYDTINKMISHNTFLLISISLVYTFVIDNIMFIFPAYYRNLYLLTFMLIFSYVIFNGYIVYSNYLYYLKKTGVVFINTFIAGVANVVMNYFLIQRYGYIGATVATLISYVIMYFMFYFSVKKIFGSNIYDFRKMSLALLASCILIVIYYLIRGSLALKVIYILITISALGYIYYIRRKANVKQ